MRMGSVEERGVLRRRPEYMTRLQKIQDLGHVLFVAIFCAREIAAPFAGIPDLHAVIQADQNYFRILIKRDHFAQSPRDENAPGLVEIGGSRFRDDMVHE